MLRPNNITLTNNNLGDIMEYETAMEPVDTVTKVSSVCPASSESNNLDFITKRNGFSTFANTPLKETIQAHCLLADIEMSKILVLICYNETDIFGKVLINWLNNSARIKNLLSHPIFIVCGYNISMKSNRNDLVRSLTDVVRDQHDILCSVQAGNSKIYLLVPYCDIIVSQSYIDESMSEDEAVSMLYYMEDLFNGIKRLRRQEEKKNDTAVTCEIFQQLMMCRLRNRSYDIFFADDHQYLKDKIGFAYFGAPVNTDGTYSTKENKTIESAYKTIMSQSDNHAMDNGVVVISFIYVCCLNFKEQRSIETKQIVSNVNKENFSPLPCFVLRKCYNENNPSAEYCRIVIDNTLRVYQSWDKFLHENTYPKCIMCVPKEGRYDCDVNGDVLLEYYYSPACNIPQTALRAIDTTAAVAGIGSGSVLLLAVIPAVSVILAPVAIVGALAISAGAGLYSIGRSIHRLVDRSLHNENLSPAEPEARAAYIGIVAGSLGFAGAGANVIIANLAKNGVRIGQGAVLTVDAISKANLAAGGIAITNSVCDVAHSYIIKKETPSNLVFVQLGASVLFFTNAVYNYKNTTEIIASCQKGNAIQEFINSLRTRKEPSTTGMLSALRKSTNEDETIAMLMKNPEQFNEVGIKYADGYVYYIGQIMNIAQFTKAINTVDIVDVTDVTLSNTRPAKSFMNINNITLLDLNSLALKVISASSNAKDVELTVLNLLQLFLPAVQTKLLDLIDQIFTSDMCRPVSSFCEKFGSELKMGLKNRSINVEIISQIISYLVSKAQSVLNVDLGSSRGVRYVQVLIINCYLCGRSISAQLVQDCIQHLNLYVAKKVVSCIKGSEDEERMQMINRRKRLPCGKCTGQYHTKK